MILFQGERVIKMKNFKKLLFLGIMLIFLCTGCKQDDMEGIDIVVTNYANEYIASQLYGNHANIESIYPDGVSINKYKVTNKQKKDYSNKGLFIYNGIVKKERDLAVNLLDLNGNLKIIDSSYVLDEEYSPEELWLNPSSLLMMAKNIQLGLEEYVDSTYLRKEIDEAYNKLKVILSELDADYRIAVNDTKNRTIVVNEANLKYLEKFGLSVICLDDESNTRTMADVETLIKDGAISYLYNFNGDPLNNNSKMILEKYNNVKEVKLHRLDNLTDKEREDKKDYISIMKDNLDLLKQELYQ